MGYHSDAIGNVTQRVSFKVVDLFSLDISDKAIFNKLTSNFFTHDKKNHYSVLI